MSHQKRINTHKNVLYGLVVILLILQIISFVIVTSQVSRLDYEREELKGLLADSVAVIRENINGVQLENQAAISELSRRLSEQKEDIQGEINLIKATQDDFSGVIEDSVRGVVNIGTDISAGTGFIVDSSGYVLTNQHVIQGSSFIRILTYDGDVYNAELVAQDVFLDLALIKVEGEFSELEFADSDSVQVGEKVIAIGNPLGLSFTVTEGIISAVKRTGPNGVQAYIQTDVTLNPGNSGGPLINKQGKVVGVNNFKIGGAESLGFALESNVVSEFVDNALTQNLTA